MGTDCNVATRVAMQRNYVSFCRLVVPRLSRYFHTVGLEKLMKDYSENTDKEDMNIINKCRLAQTNGAMDSLKRDLLLGKGLGKIILKK